MVAGACIACEHWQGPFAWHLYAEGCGRTGSPGTFTAERRFDADPRRLVWRMSAPASCPAPVAPVGEIPTQSRLPGQRVSVSKVCHDR